MSKSTSKSKQIGFSYIRFSTPDQAEGDSLRRQLEATEAWCKRNGVTLDTSLNLQDLGVSAFTGKHRDNPDKFALASFVEQVQKPNSQIAPGSFLIVENLDRLTREHVRTATRFFLDILDSQISIVTTSPEKIYRHDSLDMTDIILAVIELSRGHAESARKSDLVGRAWTEKKAVAIRDKKALTAMCPHWLRVEGEQYVPIPERVEVVRRIFKDTAEGVGIGALCRKLNKEGIPPWQAVRRKKDVGKPHLWQKSSVARILSNRAVLGEYQEHKGHRERKAVGDPVPDFYPRVISDGLFHQAQQGTATRKKVGVVERSATANLFSGLVFSEDGCSWVYHNKGAKQDHVLARADGLTGGKDYLALSYRIFERLILDNLREVTPADLMPSENKKAEAERLSQTQAELEGVTARHADLTKRLSDPRFANVDAILTAIGDLDLEKGRLNAECQELRRAIANPVVEGVGEAQTLMGMLREKPSPELRAKLRAKVASVVERIMLAVFANRGVRMGWAQIKFRRTGYVRNIVFMHQIRRKSRNFEKPEVVWVVGVHELPKSKSFFDDDYWEKTIDLMNWENVRDSGDIEAARKEARRVLEKWDKK